MESLLHFLWVLVHTRICFCPPRVEFLFPLVLWKSCNQPCWSSKPDSLGILSPFARYPGWEAALPLLAICPDGWPSHRVYRLYGRVMSSEPTSGHKAKTFSSLREQRENFFCIIVVQFVICPSGRDRIWFLSWLWPLLPSCCSFSFVFGQGMVLLGGGSSIFLLMLFSLLAVILVLLQEEIWAHFELKIYLDIFKTEDH